MTWPPPGLEEEARRAEHKLRQLLQEEREQKKKEWPRPPEVPAQTAQSTAPKEAPSPSPKEMQGQDPQQNFKEQVETEINEIKELIELASGQGYMKMVQEEVVHPAPQRSSPPAIRYYSVSQFEAVETAEPRHESPDEPLEEEPTE